MKVTRQHAVSARLAFCLNQLAGRAGVLQVWSQVPHDDLLSLPSSFLLTQVDDRTLELYSSSRTGLIKSVM